MWLALRLVDHMAAGPLDKAVVVATHSSVVGWRGLGSLIPVGVLC